MKVVKLKAGYRVTMNDTEFDALRHVSQLGMAATASQAKNERLAGLAGGKLRTDRFIQDGGPLATVDDDRREGGA